MEQTKASSLIDMANGAIKERLDYEMGRVIQNISDPNTKATAKRTITVKITLEPDEERQHVEVSATASSTLAALPLYVSCNSYDSVKVFTRPIADADLFRWTPYTANASDLPPLVEDVRWSFDEAMIKLRSMFQRAPEGEKNDVDYILDLLSHMSFDQSVKSDDNGITQTVQVRKGVSFVENKAVRPIVTLAPYRTFQEVEQPESEFVFRVYDDRSISLTAADGGMWKLAARDAVKHYLETALCDEIAAGKVKVTL